MKTFIMWKLPILLGSFAAALIFSPACKAQSEISPDHFEDRNTEPFARTANASVPEASKAPQKPLAAQVQTRNSSASSAKQVLAVRNSNPAEPHAVALQDKRKTTAPKSPKP
jgi:hypothetical protein